MPPAYEREYQTIKRSLTTAHPTFTNFQTYYQQNKGVKPTGESLFTDTRCVGKKSYMAPEVMYKVSDDGRFYISNQCYQLSTGDGYDARKADIWTLGIMLFMMCTGVPLYEYPNPSYEGFRRGFAGDVRSYIVETVRRGSFVTEDILDLLNKIFTPAKNRITMDELLQHPFVGLIDNVNPNVVEKKDDEGGDSGLLPLMFIFFFCFVQF